MKLIQKYINNISALQFVQLLRFATLFLVGIVFVRIYSTQQIGYYETLIFIAGALSFFWLRGVLQSFPSLVKNKNKAYEHNQSIAYFNGFVILVLFSVLTVLFLTLFKNLLSNLLNNSQPVIYFKWLLLYILFGSPANFIEYIYLGLNKPKSIISYGIISQTAQFLMVIVPAVLGYPLEVSIIGLVIINVLRFVWVILILYKNTFCKLNVAFIKEHLKLAYPLIVSALLSGSAQYIDGFIVTHFYDSTMFAIFRYGARELPIALILANAFSNAMIPEFSSLSLNDAIAKLKRNSSRLMHLLYPLTILLLIISNWLFPRMFSEEFTLSAKIFNVYLLLIVFRLLFPQTILIGLRKTNAFLWIAAIEIIINVSLSLVFIQLFGVIGVAYATIVAFSVEKLILVLLVKKWFSISLRNYQPVGLWIFYSIFTIITFIIIDFILFI